MNKDIIKAIKLINECDEIGDYIGEFSLETLQKLHPVRLRQKEKPLCSCIAEPSMFEYECNTCINCNKKIY